MHYILFLSLQGLYVSFAQRREGDVNQPIAIHRDRRVIDVNAAARQVGGQVGTALTEAKSSWDGVRFIEWKADDDEAARALWLDGLLDFTDRIETVAPHEAYLDLTGHPDPLSIVPSCLERANFPLVAGLGCSKWIARATTHAGQPLSQDHVVRPEQSLKELPAQLLPIPHEVAERLIFLGYRTIGQVQKATREVLVKQFDDIGSVIHSAARGGQIDPVVTNYPPGTISVRVYLDEPWETEAVKESALRSLASRMGRALVDKDRAARCLQLILVGEDGKLDERERVFSKPLRTGAQVFMALKELSEELFPATEARARLSMLESAPARQLELARLRSVGLTQHMNDAVDGVRAKFGLDSLKPASEVKLPRRRAVLRAWCDATGWL